MTSRIAFALCVLMTVSACASSTASYRYAQKQLQHENISFHETLRVDEYLNAFPQDWLNVPAGKNLVVRMDPLAVKRPGEVRSLIYQIAVKTRRPTREEIAAPVALSFVADVSGSMGGEKITDMRQSLIDAISELKDNDRVSLTVFNNDAKVIASGIVIDAASRQRLMDTVRAIKAGGGTDIEAGLVAGYRELAAFPRGMNKRLIMLTDGQSNVGTLTPQQIAEKAVVAYQEGSRISTIGLGLDVNQDLLRRIADNGKGHYYFAENSRELTRILRDDLHTTVIPTAKEVTLVLELAAGYTFESLYGPGAGPVRGKTAVTVQMGELNANDWRILIAEIDQTGEPSPKEPIHLSGSYRDITDDRKHSLEGLSRGTVVEAGGPLPNINTYVLRNSVLYGNALALIEASRLNQERRYSEAIQIVDAQLNNNRVLETVDRSEMVKKEQQNLDTVRAILLKKKGAQTEPAAKTADPSAAPPAGSGLKGLILDGLRISQQVLPGLWSTVAQLLITALQ